jgi:hypothetical protein
MEGYEVFSSDDQKLGQVARVEDGYLIVERKHLLKEKHHAVPLAFAHADDSEKVVRLSVSKKLIEDGPEIKDGGFDRKAIAEHYGLAEGAAGPETLGEGELLPDDPALSAEQEELRLGIEPEAQRIARIHRGDEEPGPRGRQIIPSDPHKED